jgi:hypothetical protein
VILHSWLEELARCLCPHQVQRAAKVAEKKDPPSIEAHAHSIYQGLTINVFLLQGQAINVGVGVAGFDTTGRTWCTSFAVRRIMLFGGMMSYSLFAFGPISVGAAILRV